MFRVGGIDEHPLHIHPRLLERDSEDALYPILIEHTPVRLDHSQSAWSDIFFLGMDYPEGARVLNISVDLGVHGRDLRPGPPIECWVRVIARPLLRLTSIDLNSCKDVESLEELFNFGNDYLGLVKAGVIASGLVPPSLGEPPSSWKTCWRVWFVPGMDWKSSSTPTTFPKVRGWPSRPTCWRR